MYGRRPDTLLLAMKQNTKITFSAMMAALAVAFMLLSYFPYLTYAIPAIAGLFIMAVVIEINCKWAFLAYLSSAVLVFISAEPESRLLYVFFLGYYPIIKALIERWQKPAAEWVVKILLFNLAVLLVYWIFAKPMGIDFDDFGTLGKYGALITLGIGNVAFILYDIAVSRMAVVYMMVIRPKIKRIFK